jgi:hypothetical protein
MTVTPQMGFAPNMNSTPDIGAYIKGLERRIARLERTTNGLDTDPTPEFVTSLTVTGLVLASQTVTVDQDGYKVYLRFTWNDISSDPNAINKDEVDYFLVSHTIDGANWTGEAIDRDQNAVVGPYAQGLQVTFRVRAHTKKGVLGPYAQITVTTTSDNVSPAQPSTPVVSPYLGQLLISWDGLSSTAAQMPGDFRYAEVHLATSGPTFTPTSSTMIGTLLRGGGDWVATDLTYGTTYYARLVAVDSVGNRSSTSTAGSAVPEQLVTGDVADGVITTAKIANLAVNNAKISDLSVGKLTAGTMTVNMTVSGRIATSLTGARVEINSAGLQAFDAGGNQTVSVSSATGDAILTGRFRTGFSGARLEMTDTTDRTTIYFYPPAGTNTAFMNSPADSNGIPRWGVNTGQFTYNGTQSRHRLFLDNEFGIRMETYRTVDGSRNGYALFLGELSTVLYWYGGSGDDSGGGLYMDNNQYELHQVTDGNYRGGRLYGDNESLWLQVYASSANINVECQMSDDGTIRWHRGRYPNFEDLGQEQAVFTGKVGASTGTAWVIAYGTSRVATPATIVTPQFNAATGWAVTSSTAAQFQVTSVNTVAGNINFWNYRMN